MECDWMQRYAAILNLGFWMPDALEGQYRLYQHPKIKQVVVIVSSFK